MKLLTHEDLQSLSDLSSANLAITVSTTAVTLRLTQVVALTNFKAVAAAGRAGPSASFDGKTKTLVLALRPVSDAVPGVMTIGFEGKQVAHGFRFGGQFYEAASNILDDVVAIYPNDNWKQLMAVAKRLSGDKAKTFKNTKDAMTHKRVARKRGSSQSSTDMDMPMWDPLRREFYDGEWESRTGGRMA